LAPARACTSSTITVSTPRQRRLAPPISVAAGRATRAVVIPAQSGRVSERRRRARRLGGPLPHNTCPRCGLATRTRPAAAITLCPAGCSALRISPVSTGTPAGLLAPRRRALERLLDGRGERDVDTRQRCLDLRRCGVVSRSRVRRAPTHRNAAHGSSCRHDRARLSRVRVDVACHGRHYLRGVWVRQGTAEPRLGWWPEYKRTVFEDVGRPTRGLSGMPPSWPPAPTFSREARVRAPPPRLRGVRPCDARCVRHSEFWTLVEDDVRPCLRTHPGARPRRRRPRHRTAQRAAWTRGGPRAVWFALCDEMEVRSERLMGQGRAGPPSHERLDPPAVRKPVAGLSVAGPRVDVCDGRRAERRTGGTLTRLLRPTRASRAGSRC
jgi:hypothetical protein